LSQALQFNSSLTSLDLISNQIGEGVARHLASALRFNSTLTSLPLSGNRIEEPEAKINQTIKEYSISFHIHSFS
jgi:hypothetical protein